MENVLTCLLFFHFSLLALILSVGLHTLLGAATSNSIISDEVFTHPYD